MSKRILITGSTDGIGKLAATMLAQQGHHVYLHGRNAEKLLGVIDEIRDLSDVSGEIDGFVADFSDLASVRAMGNQVLEQLPQLDVLINNAGIFKTSMTQTRDSLDVRFVVNYFSPYVLTNAALPALRASGGARVINLSSAAQAPVSMAALGGEISLSDNAAYAQSKLALTMWSMGLARELASEHVNVIAVNPGSLLNTRMVAEAYGQHWSSASKGANILVELAVSTAYAADTGRYFDNDQGEGETKGDFSQAHPDTYNEVLIAQLLKQTSLILGRLGA